MSQEASTRAPSGNKRGHSRGGGVLPRYDQALRNAKNDGKLVKFQLADETYFTGEDCTVVGKVMEVDKFDVQIETNPSSVINSICVWIKKGHIVATEVLV